MGAVEKVQFQAPARAGQATMVEQSRAVAEVQAAVVVAQQIPRVVATSVAEMEESCGQLELAEQAFFSFPRGGKNVKGATVHLARELARCWGNVQYGIAELSRDAERSEMMAWAWDVQTNTRSSQTFIVPHKRDKRDGAEALTDMRDIYENNANHGARRVREAIFNVLPPWYTAKAEELCRRTLEHGGGKPLAQRVADAVSLFGGLGVSVPDLERSVGRPQAEWTAHDVSQLGVKFKTIDRGEASVGDLFPRETAPVSVADIEAQAASPVPLAGDVPDPEDPTRSSGSAPEPPVEVEVARVSSDELKAEAKQAKASLRSALGQKQMGELFAANDLSQQESRWTEGDARRIVELEADRIRAAATGGAS